MWVCFTVFVKDFHQEWTGKTLKSSEYRSILLKPEGWKDQETFHGNVIHQGKEIKLTRTDPFSNTTRDRRQRLSQMTQWYLWENRDKLGECLKKTSLLSIIWDQRHVLDYVTTINHIEIPDDHMSTYDLRRERIRQIRSVQTTMKPIQDITNQEVGKSEDWREGSQIVL